MSRVDDLVSTNTELEKQVALLQTELDAKEHQLDTNRKKKELLLQMAQDMLDV